MSLPPLQQAALKQLVGSAAADLLRPGMRVGLGTGSTTAYFIAALIERVHAGLVLAVLPSSHASERMALAGRLPLLDPIETQHLDLYVDGADAVDPEGRLIKGGGGALLREKITAAMSRLFIVVVDASKHVASLEGLRLPVEILPFGTAATLGHLKERGCDPQLRHTKPGVPFLTDNGNWICDVLLPAGGKQAERFAQSLLEVPGVLAHGLFTGMAKEIWTGETNGEVRRDVL
jgi:ribose 5-phosphate isomerase A